MVGVNLTVNVVLPDGPATGAVGLAVMLKSPGCDPANVMPSPVRLESPVFLMVNVRSPVEPNATDPKDLDPPDTILVPAG